ncbi:hypothetical protein [Leptolyngbya sp. BC1307]|uniref:hypothetical protein n=1 Tax=Leptolyngbya sp. BC1307 TaxID=2029589 RepID=UPI000EFA3878|nr:hypothetical protein [Leptolyngbya sp. BC1307]
MKKIGAGLIPISGGIVLTNFDFTYDSFGRFDLFPDFVGYGLIAMGLGGLIRLSKQFAIARLCAWVLMPIAIIRWLCPPTILMAFEWVDTGLNAVMIWMLLSGIRDYSAREHQSYLLKWSSVYRIAYVGLICVAPMMLNVVSPILPPPPPGELGVIFALGLVAAFFWAISPFMILDLLVHFKRDLDKRAFR